MFYLETKDGDKFFTSPESDDCVEFDKIIESKLGREASELYNQLLEEKANSNIGVLEKLGTRLDEIIDDLDKISNSDIKASDVKIYLEELRELSAEIDNYL